MAKGCPCKPENVCMDAGTNLLSKPDKPCGMCGSVIRASIMSVKQDS